MTFARRCRERRDTGVRPPGLPVKLSIEPGGLVGEIAIDDVNVYWAKVLPFVGSTVSRVPKIGGAPVSVVSFPEVGGLDVDYVSDFAIDSSGIDFIGLGQGAIPAGLFRAIPR